ncbi:MAG: electron transport complex subunit RsxA [Caldiserica bacterium]|nr:MAG: electron transport complex subunit RsxA [Caldisericota bacterium]
MKYIGIFLTATFVNNMVLHYFLGICPFLGISGALSTAIGMGFAVIFVMTLASVSTYLIYYKILIPLNLPYLQYVSFILVIASLVQLVEMFLKKYSRTLYKALGIYLPLITTNCAILGVTLFMILKKYTFLESIFFSLGSGFGFMLALLIMAGIREEIRGNDIPEGLKGPGITLIIAGILALGFMGFSGF